MLNSRELEFIMEAHNGLSAKIVQETGIFKLPYVIAVSCMHVVIMSPYMVFIYIFLDMTILQSYCHKTDFSRSGHNWGKRENFGTVKIIRQRFCPYCHHI